MYQSVLGINLAALRAAHTLRFLWAAPMPPAPQKAICQDEAQAREGAKSLPTEKHSAYANAGG